MKDAIVGINPDTRIVNTVATLSESNVMEMLRAGEVIVPVTKEQCRQLWGQPVLDALQLPNANVAPPEVVALRALVGEKQPLGIDRPAYQQALAELAKWEHIPEAAC